MQNRVFVKPPRGSVEVPRVVQALRSHPVDIALCPKPFLIRILTLLSPHICSIVMEQLTDSQAYGI